MLVRERLCFVTAFFAFCFLLEAREGRFAVACARAVLWTRFARLVLAARGFAIRIS